MDKKHLAMASQEYINLLDFIAIQPDGADLDYNQVARETGVKMDNRGKAILRRVIEACGRRYTLKRKYGYILDSPENALEISDNSIVKFVRQTVRTKKTTEVILDRHSKALDKSTRDILLLRKIVATEIVQSSESKLLTHKPEVKSQPPNIPLP